VSNPNIQTILNCPFLPQSLVAPADEASQDFDALALTLTQAQADRDAAQKANIALQSQIQALQAQIAAAANVKVFDGLELIPGIVAGGSVANSSGNPGVAADTEGVPTDKEAFREIIPNGQYEDKYWFWQLGADATKTKFTYEGRLMLPTAADCAAAQAVELDIEQRIATAIAGQVTIYNTGGQWDFAGSKTFRIWNRGPVNHGWVSTPIAIARWNPGEWHTFKLECHGTRKMSTTMR